MGTLAVRLTVPLAGPVEDLHLQVSAPCRAYQKRGVGHMRQPLVFSGSPGRTRTADQVVNSHPLYLLSYRGLCPTRSGWGTRIRTWIGRSRVCSPAVGRSPNFLVFIRRPRTFVNRIANRNPSTLRGFSSGKYCLGRGNDSCATGPFFGLGEPKAQGRPLGHFQA